MPLPSSPNQISMSDIAVEKKGSGLPSGGYWQNISLKGLSVNSVTDFSYYNGDSLITADYTGTPNSSAPYGVGEFHGYAHELPTVSNVQNYTGSNAASFVRVLSSYNGYGFVRVEYQLVMKTTQVGSNYVATLYVEETSNGLGSYNSAAMNTGTLYPIQTVTFTQANWPDSYALDHSVNAISSPGGAIATDTTLLSGTGETHTSGSNWDNSTKELLNPTTGTAFKVRHNTTAECWTGVATYDDTISLKFIKSGYPTLTAATFTIDTEQDMNHTGLCP